MLWQGQGGDLDTNTYEVTLYITEEINFLIVYEFDIFLGAKLEETKNDSTIMDYFLVISCYRLLYEIIKYQGKSKVKIELEVMLIDVLKLQYVL